MKKEKTLAKNKSARHDYFIEETIEAGLVLTGTEIKSLRQGRVSLGESYARIMDYELFLYAMNIKPYDFGNIHNTDPVRPRKLLVHKKQIRHLIEQTKLQGFTIIPLRLYLNDQGLAKIEIALAKGKKNYDKRETIAKRDAERRIQQVKKYR